VDLFSVDSVDTDSRHIMTIFVPLKDETLSLDTFKRSLKTYLLATY